VTCISPSDLGFKAVETGADCKGGIIMRKLCCTLQRHQTRITYLAEMEEDHCAAGPVVIKCYFDRDDNFKVSCCQKLLQFQDNKSGFFSTKPDFSPIFFV
jgi:hypothetical protein